MGESRASVANMKRTALAVWDAVLLLAALPAGFVIVSLMMEVVQR